jgi:alpha-methylacyl-CoA racemase
VTDEAQARVGPLAGLRVLEMAGIGPGPFCAMLLADMGADVLRVDRAGAPPQPFLEVVGRGRRSVVLDLKSPEDVQTCLRLIERADVLIEGFRPGVMERLGLGPDLALARNPGLVYGRMTGWGQDGPLARTAGHDINYIGLSGALAALGPPDRPPPPPLNLVGDYGGGSLYLAFGIMAALYERRSSGLGQVVDGAVLDGAASMMAVFCGMAATGLPVSQGQNFLAGAAPFYRCYACADGRYLAVGALEPQFYGMLVERAGLDASVYMPQPDPSAWPEISERLQEVMRTRTRDEWVALLEGTDACVTPVLDLAEAADHPHNQARGVFQNRHGVVQPAPAPRFGRTPGAIGAPAPSPGEGGQAALREWLGGD